MIASFLFVFIVPSLTSATFENDKFVDSDRDKEANYCLLPPFPEHGKYTVSNNHSATPRNSYQYVKLNVTCDMGYLSNNTINRIFCINGEWSSTMPTCVPAFCTLINDLGIEYRCLSVSGSLERSHECPSMVPSGTLVMPICRSPAYFSLRTLSEMHCRDGIWDYNPICKPACGLVTQHRKLEGSSTNHLELPWHAVIYEKMFYQEICIGSLISASIVISSASCFITYSGNHLIASSYLVAVNKMYSEYNDPRDVNSQESAVVDIKIPSDYRYNAMNSENDIAIVVVERSFIFHLSVRPVCLDFDNNLDKSQLADGNYGKAVRWSNTENSYFQQSSFVLNVIDLQLRTDHQLHLSNDQFYAASNVSRIHHQMRDCGSGLAVLEPTTQRYYLRGVGLIFYQMRKFEKLFKFTSIVKHEYFIKEHCNSC